MAHDIANQSSELRLIPVHSNYEDKFKRVADPETNFVSD